MIMKNKIINVMIICTLCVCLCSCALTGSLSDAEYKSMIEFIVANTDISNISDESTIGAGEGEFITYSFSGMLNGEKRQFNLKQSSHKEDFRVFTVKDVTDKKWIEIIKIRIDKDGKLSMFEEK